MIRDIVRRLLGEVPSRVFAVGTGEYENYCTWAVFTTREKAEAWAESANRYAVSVAGVPGKSCQTKEEAARSWSVEDWHVLALDPSPDEPPQHIPWP